MPAPTITDSERPLSNTDIDAVEEALGASLPVPYRRFLLRHNGGDPEPSACVPPHSVRSFYSIKARMRVYDLLANWRSMRKRLPSELIPIACGYFGDDYCLAFKGKNRGKVYFWDHEGTPERVDIRAKFPEIDWKPYGPDDPRPKVTDDWPGHPDLTLIADSFDEFLDSFHDINDAEPEASTSKKRTGRTEAGWPSGSREAKKVQAKKPAAATKKNPAGTMKKASGTTKKPAAPKQAPRGRRTK